jgi:DNA-binding response OmpR family regulator
MSKIMLVEDDNNLREIYGARLMAEGYEIVSAADGEEALALAVKENPDLIISDVMMPKISGFDMLDILRTTPETKDTKVIMMTALSQPEDRERGEKLGANKYLVKSQVTLEDVVAAVHEILGDGEGAEAAPAEAPKPSLATPPQETETNIPQAEPEFKTVEPDKVESTSVNNNEVAAANTPPVEPKAPAEGPGAAPATEPPAPEPPAEDTDDNDSDDDAPEPASKKKKVIEPINDLSKEPDIVKMAEEEEAREKESQPGVVHEPVSGMESNISENLADEKKEMEEQIQDFVDNGETTPPPVAEPVEAVEAPAAEPVPEPAPASEPGPTPTEPAPAPAEAETPEQEPEKQPEAALEPAPTPPPVEAAKEEPMPKTPEPGSSVNPNDIAL